MLSEVNFLAAKRGKTEIGDAIITTCGKSGHKGSLNQPDKLSVTKLTWAGACWRLSDQPDQKSTLANNQLSNVGLMANDCTRDSKEAFSASVKVRASPMSITGIPSTTGYARRNLGL
jgi:hypothetical protein